MNDIITIELDATNRIRIPPDVQKRLGLTPGMMLVVEEEQSGGVTLQIQSDAVTLINEGGVLVAQVEAIGDLTDSVRQERDSRATGQ